MRRPRGDLVSTRLQPMHRPALQDDDARPCSSVETPLAPFASSSSPSTLSTAPEQHTPPGLATVGETNSPSPTPQPTFHDPVPHVSTTSMQHALSNNSAIMMSAEDPSREVLDRALAKEASPVIGSTSEVPAHDVPSMTGAPEPAEPVRFVWPTSTTRLTPCCSRLPHLFLHAIYSRPKYPRRESEGSSTTEVGICA